MMHFQHAREAKEVRFHSESPDGVEIHLTQSLTGRSEVLCLSCQVARCYKKILKGSGDNQRRGSSAQEGIRRDLKVLVRHFRSCLIWDNPWYLGILPYLPLDYRGNINMPPLSRETAGSLLPKMPPSQVMTY